jgi:CRISPR system Cascade subunit CasE
MSALFLSRARLKRDPSVAALAPLLLPDGGGPRAHAAHRLVWSLFADEPQGARPFLFRELQPSGARGGGSELLILSKGCRPRADGPLFEVDSKDFAPLLSRGDRLAFSLRANATVAGKKEGTSKRSDIVMHALHDIPRDARAGAREAATLDAARRWLAGQGERAGFRLDEDEEVALRVTAYDVWRFPRLGPNGRLGVLDLDGVLEVIEPAAFLAHLADGFGRAKSFGCGLMLIRRAG